MFFTTKKQKCLEGDVTSLNKVILGLQTKIALSDSNHGLEIARLKGIHDTALLQNDLTITGIKSTAKQQVTNEVDAFKARLVAEYEEKNDERDEELEEAKEDLQDEYTSKFKTLETSLKTAEGNASKYQGLYDGALISIKTLTSQLEAANTTIKLLCGKLPEMSATMTSPRDIGATVNVAK